MTYAELLQVVKADIVAEQVDQRILEHAAVAVAAGAGQPSCCVKRGARLDWPPLRIGKGREKKERAKSTYERTKRSRLTQLGFLGLKVMNLLKTTWAKGAMPMGAPGWPELAWNVASTCRAANSQLLSGARGSAAAAVLLLLLPVPVVVVVIIAGQQRRQGNTSRRVNIPLGFGWC